MKKALIMFLGVPGSGKSYFAKKLAKKIDAVRLNGDSMRVAIWGSIDKVESARSKGKNVNRKAFRAIDYAAIEILRSGNSVIYDAHHNKFEVREKLANLAREFEAIPIVVYIKTPPEIAKERALSRDPVDQVKFDSELWQKVYDQQMLNFSEPDVSENVIEIDGTLDFSDQYHDFLQQFNKLNKEAK